MLAKTLIDLLVSSELSQLPVSDLSGSREERDSNRHKILGYINLGLIELHKRFLISTDTVVLNAVTASTTSWDLPKTFISPVSAMTNKYSKVSVNKLDAGLTLSFPSPYTCKFTNNSTDINNSVEVVDSIILTFKAASADISSVEDDILLPIQYLEALINYVAYKAHGAISSTAQSENNTYYNRFEASCKRLLNEGLSPVQTYTSTKLEDRGFA